MAASNQATLNFNSLAAYQAAKPFISETCKKILKILAIKEMTTEEIALAMGKYPNQISGRFKPMLDSGWIKKVGERKTHTGCIATVWAPVHREVAE